MQEKEYFSTFEVAKICQVSPGSVVRWIREGKIESATTGGGHHRIPRRQLIGFMRSMNMTIPDYLTAQAYPKVLVVDDEEGIRHLVRTIMGQIYPDMRLEEAAEGFLAGWRAHGLRPDLVILDIMIPGMNGFQVCQFIRSFDELAHTKILAISGLNEEATQRKAYEAGADDFLAKPFGYDELKVRVEKLLKSEAK